MRALRKGQARPWCLQPGIRGEVRLVERPFGIGPSALTEAMGTINHHFAAAACSAQSNRLPLTAATLCNTAFSMPAFPDPARDSQTGLTRWARTVTGQPPLTAGGDGLSKEIQPSSVEETTERK